jgi:hypothetical protein
MFIDVLHNGIAHPDLLFYNKRTTTQKTCVFSTTFLPTEKEQDDGI